MAKQVYCELNDAGEIIRIVRLAKEYRDLPEDRRGEFDKAEAVGQIRAFVSERCKDSDGLGACEFCGAFLNQFLGEMHERHARGERIGGKLGEVSRANSVFICHDCHTGRPDSAHGNRRWQTAKLA